MPAAGHNAFHGDVNCAHELLVQVGIMDWLRSAAVAAQTKAAEAAKQAQVLIMIR